MTEAKFKECRTGAGRDCMRITPDDVVAAAAELIQHDRAHSFLNGFGFCVFVCVALVADRALRQDHEHHGEADQNSGADMMPITKTRVCEAPADKGSGWRRPGPRGVPPRQGTPLQSEGGLITHRTDETWHLR
jgi:hypothetical protein